MTQRPHDEHAPQLPGRRTVLRLGAGLGIAGALGDAFAWAQRDDLEPYKSAEMNWRQPSRIDHRGGDPGKLLRPYLAAAAIRGVPAQAALREGAARQIRQKAVLDLASKTATYATHAADPMYHPLTRRTSGSGRSIATSRPTLTDPAWFKDDDIIKAWRDADSYEGKPTAYPTTAK